MRQEGIPLLLALPAPTFGCFSPTSATGLSLGAKTLRTATWKSPSYCQTLGPTFCGLKEEKLPELFYSAVEVLSGTHIRYEGVNASLTQC